jgi:hypothetical protein
MTVESADLAHMERKLSLDFKEPRSVLTSYGRTTTITATATTLGCTFIGHIVDHWQLGQPHLRIHCLSYLQHAPKPPRICTSGSKLALALIKRILYNKSLGTPSTTNQDQAYNNLYDTDNRPRDP